MRFAGSPQVANFLAETPDYGMMAKTGIQSRGMEKRMSHEAEGLVAGTGLDALAKVNSATEAARGIVAQGEAQGASSQAQGMSSMMSGIAGGIGNMSFGGGGGGGIPSFTSPSVGNSIKSGSTWSGAPMAGVIY